MAVTANQLMTVRRPGARNNVPVAASKRLYEGTLSFLASGYLTDVVNTGSNKFAGVVIGEVDNSSGSAGDLNAEVYREGDFVLTGSGFSQATVGSKIYASDNYTVTTTSTNNTLIGVCVGYVSATKILVAIDAHQLP